MARLSSIPGYKRARPPRDLLPRLFDIQPPPPDAQEKHRLLVQKVSKAVGLSILPGFCDSYVPKVLELTLPKALNTFFSKNLLTSSYEELLVLADEAFESLSCNDEEAETVEKETREQSETKLWYEIRAGRITGSKFHAAVHTVPEKPSVSLLKSICYPMASKFQTESTRWGLKNEPVAMTAYQKLMGDVHGDFVVEQRGFMLLKSFPFIGASSDGAVFCSCHGPGLVEIKCPFSHRQRYVKEAALADKNFCCPVGADGSLRLKDSHPYFYQIQLTMFIMEVTYCHFVIWTQVDCLVLETEYDESLVPTHLPRSELLFRKAVLPELLGKYFTREQGRGVKRGMSDENSEILPCYCRTEKDPNVPTVVCSASTCLVRRFHIPCLGLKRIAKEWKCVECRKQSAKKRRSNPDKTSLSK